MMLIDNRTFGGRLVIAAVFLLITFQSAYADDAQLRREMLEAYNQYQELFKSGKYNLAVTPAATAIKKAKELHAGPNAETAILYYNHGLTSLGAGLRDGGVRSLEIADEMYVALGDEHRSDRIPVLLSLGDTEKKTKAALKIYDRALEISAEVHGEKSADHAENLITVGTTTFSTKGWKKAEPYLVKADRVLSESAPWSDARRTTAAYSLARWQIKAKRDAIPALQRAIAGFEARDEVRHPDYRRSLEWLSERADKADDEILVASIAAKLSEYYKTAPANEDDYLPIRRVAPYFPSEALQKGITGYVDLKFTVMPNGRTTDIEPVGGENVRVFAAAAIQAVSDFKYKPRVIDGEAVAVENVQTRIRFELER